MDFTTTLYTVFQVSNLDQAQYCINTSAPPVQYDFVFFSVPDLVSSKTTDYSPECDQFSY